MQRTQEQNEPSPIMQAGNIAYSLVSGCAMVAEVFIRRRFGSRYFHDWRCVIGFLFIVCTASLCQTTRDVYAMWGLVYGYLGLIVFHNLAASSRQAQNIFEHSKYNGWPRLCDLTGWSEPFCKKWAEVFATILGGVCLLPLAPPLAITFMIAGFCLATTHSLIERHELVEAQRMADAELHLQAVMERFGRVKGARR
jgi:hypothetical protein